MHEPGRGAAELARDAPVKALRAVFAGIGQILLAADRFRDQAESGDQGIADDDPFQQLDAPADRVDAEVDVSAPVSAPEPARKPKAAQATKPKAARTAKPKAARTAKPKEARTTKPAAAKGKAAKHQATAKAKAAGRERRSADPKGNGEAMRVGKPGRSGRAAQERRFRSLDATGNVRVLSPADIAELQEDMAESAPKSQGRATSPQVRSAGGSGRPGPASAPARPEAAARPGKLPRPRAETRPAPPLPGYDELSIPALRSRLRSLDIDQLQALLAYERSTADREEFVSMLGRRITKLQATASDAT